MSITEVTNNYCAEKIPDIIKDYKQVRTVFGLKQKEEDDAPWWSGDIVEEAKEKDYLCARACFNGNIKRTD